MINKDLASTFVPNCSQGLHMHATFLEQMASSSSSSSAHDSYSTSLLYNLSILKEKVHQAQSLVNMSMPPESSSQPAVSAATNTANMGTLMEEIIITASSMMFTCQQMALEANARQNNDVHNNDQARDKHRVKLPKYELQLSHHQPNVCARNGNDFHAQEGGREDQQGLYDSCETLEWYGNYINQELSDNTNDQRVENNEGSQGVSNDNNDDSEIIELNAADLLAKYTNYCQICGKGFKRDANLRMHMRAHGDEYKTNAALVNPMKKNNHQSSGFAELFLRPRKYSCPEEGCRWNRKHAKFQPLKSMICVKNHYKRSHCPKLYVCKRCSRKQFSVLSDLRTHEKHCGVLKWQCSCGTTFSRKDKLMGHVALFVGHNPVIR